MSHSTMHTSVLAREELRIFEELISRFDPLSEAEMRAVGMTRERFAVEQVREFEAGKWRPKQRTRGGPFESILANSPKLLKALRVDLELVLHRPIESTA